MKWAFAACAPILLAIGPAALTGAAQPLSVYSEFARIDAQGNVIAPETPREIISPAAVRNGFTSFQVVVQAPAKTPYTLRVGQNPENAARVTMYRAAGGKLEVAADPVQGEATEIFWMDVWIDKSSPVRRIKVEPQLFVNGDWVIYPMEMRIRENVVPDRLAGSVASGASSPFDALRANLCNAKGSTNGDVKGDAKAAAALVPETVDELHMRNSGQDVALASMLPPADRDDLRKRMGGCNARAPENPEFYLRLRDYFYTPPWLKIEQAK